MGVIDAPQSLMRSRIHLKHKTKYRMSNWCEYDRTLVQRGDITLWFSEGATASWKPAPTRRRGAQKKFSDHAIETALTLRLVFNLPLRQAEGLLRSIANRSFNPRFRQGPIRNLLLSRPQTCPTCRFPLTPANISRTSVDLHT